MSFGLYWAWRQTSWEERVHLRRARDVRDAVDDQWSSMLVCDCRNGSFAAHEMDCSDEPDKLICAECGVERPELYRSAAAEDKRLRGAVAAGYLDGRYGRAAGESQSPMPRRSRGCDDRIARPEP